MVYDGRFLASLEMTAKQKEKKKAFSLISIRLFISKIFIFLYFSYHKYPLFDIFHIKNIAAKILFFFDIEKNYFCKKYFTM